ncbi:hypothetical protein Naga_100146g6 [Nannochloropsis gaditana]|uniref:Uncharacterized protein n=1 Tax=Nannochloropsis gaditana TaxID=72520 RepID=W7TDX5_9STRA|nr:hypothetical protein Naga_100146g6 [Nannochloropsis gaditana]
MTAYNGASDTLSGHWMQNGLCFRVGIQNAPSCLVRKQKHGNWRRLYHCLEDLKPFELPTFLFLLHTLPLSRQCTICTCPSLLESKLFFNWHRGIINVRPSLPLLL